MNNSQVFVYQKRFGYFIFFLAAISVVNNFIVAFFIKKTTLEYFIQYHAPVFIVVVIGWLSTLKQSRILQIFQVIITFFIAFITINNISAVQDMTGETIAFLSILMCIQYGWLSRHFYLKVFGILLVISGFKIFVTISKIEFLTRYTTRNGLLTSFLGVYVVFCAIIFFFWLLTKDQIQEYINKGKGIEDKFRKNSVFIDIGKIVWGFLHDLGYLSNSLMEIRMLKKQLESILEDNGNDKAKINSCITCAFRIEKMLLSGSSKQEQIKKMIKAKHVLQKEHIDLNDMLNNLANYLKLTNKLRHINLDISLSPEKIYINASPFEVLQAIENIIQNCIEAIIENNGSTLKVSTSVMDSKARINITDTGGGIKFIEKSGNVNLEEFQVGRTTKTERGTGWGMYSAIINITQNGGQLTVNTVKGTGTTFEVLFNLNGRD